MHQPAVPGSKTNLTLAHVLAHAIDTSGKPRHIIAAQCGMHRETLLRISRGERPIALDEASSIFAVCGAAPRTAMILAICGEEDLACEWMHTGIGAFLEEFLITLPQHLQRTLGRRVDELRPKWGGGSAQLLARLLARHVDDLASRDIAMSLPR